MFPTAPAPAAPGQDGGVVGWEPEDLHAWQVLRPLLDLGGYLPWDAGAMRPVGLPWFDREGLDAALGSEQVDLLVVDGPPADGPGLGLARLPALAALEGRLGQDAVVVLDDVARRGEQDVLAAWQQEGRWRFDPRPAGVAIGRRRAPGAPLTSTAGPHPPTG